jgi:hypothetical protein
LVFQQAAALHEMVEYAVHCDGCVLTSQQLMPWGAGLAFKLLHLPPNHFVHDSSLCCFRPRMLGMRAFCIVGCKTVVSLLRLMDSAEQHTCMNSVDSYSHCCTSLNVTTS